MRNSLFFLALLALIVCAMPVQADKGDAFPPDLSYGGPREVTASACPSGRVMGWTGERVACVNPSYGISTGCAAGQFLAKITKGVAKCIWPVDAVCPDKQVLKELQNGNFACVGAGAGGDLDIDCVTEGTALHKMADGIETCIKVTDNSTITAECTKEGEVLRGINRGSPVCVSVGGGGGGGSETWNADCGAGRAMRRASFGCSGGVCGVETDGLLGDVYCDPDFDHMYGKDWTHMEYWKYLGGFRQSKKVYSGVIYELGLFTDGIPFSNDLVWYGAGGVALGSRRDPACSSSGKTAVCPVGMVMHSVAVCKGGSNVGNVAVRCNGYK
ncbi:MAG TPA: hypothetical protein DD400_00895 [Rhodospirillaceae bacterium]|nr:hypothetical protein [Rhodospirillaceae bacterium]